MDKFDASVTDVARALKTADENTREQKVFEWPCPLRKAHGSHLRDRHPHDDGVCPGVKAHPATQIGGNYTSW